MHARSGGNLEVMGLMQGKVIGNTMVVMDAFALPVEGTETRVNAQAQANEYMVQYLDLIKRVRFAGRARGGKEHGVWGGSGRDEGDGRVGKEHSVGAGQVGTGGTVSLPPVSRVGSRNACFACWPTPASCMYTQVGRLENAIGWYHSHPGYGCWLSGIDVTTQMTNQQFQEPFLAVVVRTRRAHASIRCRSGSNAIAGTLHKQIDPMRTISAGRVEVGAFRTYPEVRRGRCSHVTRFARRLNRSARFATALCRARRRKTTARKSTRPFPSTRLATLACMSSSTCRSLWSRTRRSARRSPGSARGHASPRHSPKSLLDGVRGP